MARLHIELSSNSVLSFIVFQQNHHGDMMVDLYSEAVIHKTKKNPSTFIRISLSNRAK